MNQKQVTDDVLSFSRTFAATPERLFAAWTQPELLSQWWGPPGSTVTLAEVDLRVGGRYRIGIRQPSGEIYFVTGTYEVVAPPETLAFSWRWEQPEMDIGTSRVVITLAAHGRETELSLTHARLPNQTARQAHREGWVGILSKLEKFIPPASKS